MRNPKVKTWARIIAFRLWRDGGIVVKAYHCGYFSCTTKLWHLSSEKLSFLTTSGTSVPEISADGWVITIALNTGGFRSTFRKAHPLPTWPNNLPLGSVVVATEKLIVKRCVCAYRFFFLRWNHARTIPRFLWISVTGNRHCFSRQIGFPPGSKCWKLYWPPLWKVYVVTLYGLTKDTKWLEKEDFEEEWCFHWEDLGDRFFIWIGCLKEVERGYMWMSQWNFTRSKWPVARLMLPVRYTHPILSYRHSFYLYIPDRCVSSKSSLHR